MSTEIDYRTVTIRTDMVTRKSHVSTDGGEVSRERALEKAHLYRDEDYTLLEAPRFNGTRFRLDDLCTDLSLYFVELVASGIWHTIEYAYGVEEVVR